jgi:hypothetical protein
MSASRVWISAMRSGSVAVSASAINAVRSRSARQHDLDQRRLFRRRFLRHLADPGVLRDRHVTGFARHLAGDDPEQRRLSGAVRPHKPGLDASGQRQRGIVDQ